MVIIISGERAIILLLMGLSIMVITIIISLTLLLLKSEELIMLNPQVLLVVFLPREKEGMLIN
jgi:hypothetical protein